MSDSAEDLQSKLAASEEEKAALTRQVMKQTEEIAQLQFTIAQQREELQTKKEALEEQEKVNSDLMRTQLMANSNGASGDSQDFNEMTRLKKRNQKLERDLKSLKDKYNSQNKELSRKGGFSSRELEKTLREIERWEMQTSKLKSQLQGMTQEPKSEAKQNSRPRNEAKSESRTGVKSDERPEPQVSGLSPDLRHEFNDERGPSEQRSVEIEIWTPGEVEIEWESLELNAGERLWGDFLSKLKPLQEEMKLSTMAVIQWGEFSVEQEQIVKAIQVLNPSTHLSEFMTASGGVIEGEMTTHSFRHFLHPNDPVLFCPDHTSILTVLTRCHVMCEQGHRRNYQLVEAPIQKIFDPQSLVLIFGLHLFNHDTKLETLFIQLNGRHYCESKTGRWFENESDVYAGYDRDDSRFRWSYLMILISNGERIPFCKVPEDTPVAAFTRFGVQLHLERGRVIARVGETSGVGPAGTWTMMKAISGFDQQLTRAMRAGF